VSILSIFEKKNEAPETTKTPEGEVAA